MRYHIHGDIKYARELQRRPRSLYGIHEGRQHMQTFRKEKYSSSQVSLEGDSHTSVESTQSPGMIGKKNSRKRCGLTVAWHNNSDF